MRSRKLLSQEKTFAVSLKGLAPWISAVKYEKEGEDLKLYFALRKEDFSPEHLSLQGREQDTLIVGNKQKQNNAEEAALTFFTLLAVQKNPTSRLFGKVLGHLRHLPGQDAYLVFLRKLDSHETKRLPQVFPLLKQLFGQEYSYCIFFEANQKYQGLAWISSPGFRAKIMQTFRPQQKHQWLLFDVPEQLREHIPYALS